jgi:type II secretory pathway component PulK
MRFRRRGSVLILVIIVTSALLALLAVLASNQQVTLKAALNRLETNRARLMANAGIARAVSELTQLESTTSVTQTGDWYVLGNLGADTFLVGEDSFRVQIVDAASLVNLNTATETQLETIGLTTEQIDSLLDWREEGDSPRTEGAKNEYYNSLPKPYNAALRPLTSVDEVLLIRGFTPRDLYSPLMELGSPAFIDDYGDTTLFEMVTVDSGSPNQSGTGQAKININNAQVQQLIQEGISAQVAAAIIARRGGGFTTLGEALRTPGMDANSAGIIVDRFTLNQQERLTGRINVNTASRAVLSTIPGIATDIAEGIYSRQSAGIANLSELFSIPGVTPESLADSIDLLTVGSDTFLVRSMGIAGNTTVSLEAVVRIFEDGPRVIKIYEMPQKDMAYAWRWSDTTTNEIDLGAAN